MIMQVTDCTCGMSAVTTGRPLPSRWRWNTLLNAPRPCFVRARFHWSGADVQGSCRTRSVSCGQPLPPGLGDRHRLAAGVVVADADALRLGDHAPAGAELVLEVEALGAEAGCPHADLDLLAERERGAEVDRDPRDDVAEIVEAADGPEVQQEGEPGGLDIGQVDGVVHVSLHVHVAEPHRLPVHEVEALHAADAIPRQRSRRRLTKRTACQRSSIAQLLLSTRPAARPISCTASKSRSVSIWAAFFGQAIQRPSAGSRVSRRAAKRRSSSARPVVKKTTTPVPGFAPSLAERGVAE